MQFRPAIFIAFVFASNTKLSFKFYNNGGNQKLKAWSFQLRKNYFCMLEYINISPPPIIELATALLHRHYCVRYAFNIWP